MRGGILWMLLWALPITPLSVNLSAQERWVYRYNGAGNGDDIAYRLAIGMDGNLYAAGDSQEGGGFFDDFTVISLDTSGTQRWVYNYNGPDGLDDRAYPVEVGTDGNVYAAGFSTASGTSRDFTVIGLTPSGEERWVYLYDGPASLSDEATWVAVGADDNLYVAGYSTGSQGNHDFTVISLDTSGTQRWVYTHNGPGNAADVASSIVVGTDSNAYAAGATYGSGTDFDLTVISLAPSGGERWVYTYNGPGNGPDWAASIMVGSDGRVYATGYSYGSGTSADFAVISLDTSGAERWVYRYNGPGNGGDVAISAVMGSDSNLYTAGYTTGSGTGRDFTTISLTPSGEERWVYSYDRSANDDDEAYSIAADTNSNLYAAGFTYASDYDITVIKLTPSGEEGWVYTYSGPGDDKARSIVMGTDGNLYIAGWSYGTGTAFDFTVISLACDARDVGTVSVDEPPDTVACDDTVRVSATVCNYGNTAETFDVEAIIDSAEVGVYADTQTVVDLLPDSCGAVSFVEWAVPPVHGVSYTVRITTLFSLDINPANDTARKEVLAWCPPGLEETQEARCQMHEAKLYQNWPNPFTRMTTIPYRIPSPDDGPLMAVSVRIYDLKGTVVRTLVEGPDEAGSKNLVWDGRDRRGRPLAGGVYFYRLRAGQFSETRRMVLLR